MKDKENKDRRVLQVSEKTAKKVDRLKALIWLKEDLKPSADSVIDYLASKELNELDKEKKD